MHVNAFTFSSNVCTKCNMSVLLLDSVPVCVRVCVCVHVHVYLGRTLGRLCLPADGAGGQVKGRPSVLLWCTLEGNTEWSSARLSLSSSHTPSPSFSSLCLSRFISPSDPLRKLFQNAVGTRLERTAAKLMHRPLT